MVGEKVHHYVIARLIGEGGMASVYEAVHEKLQTKVAIKVLNPMLAANSNIRQRFENEARFMAGLTHPNITRVIDYEERPDLLAIILEFLEGIDLNVMIKQKGPMEPRKALTYFTQVLDAFDYAHNKGIVHRDVKPSNIFIEPSGMVKILDFGIAKLIGAGDDMTMTGTQMGTPVYMSPEQVNTDKTIDHRSDIYSLGVTLYYMLKGEPPYDTTTTSSFQIYTKIVHEPLPELAKYPEIDQIIRMATDKDRAKRFQTCKEFRQALIEAAEPKKAAPEPVKTTVIVDSGKTLIDMPEPAKPAPKPVIEQKEKKKPVEKKEKPFKDSARSKKIRNMALSALGVVGIIIAILFTINSSWLSQIFVSKEEKQAKAKHFLDLGKAKFSMQYTKQNKDSAVYYFTQASKLDPENMNIQFFLGDALYQANLSDSVDITGLTFKNVSKVSEVFENIIRTDPQYADEENFHDPYARLTAIWGKLALNYMVNNRNDSALIAFREGKKRGGFNDAILENARNILNSCDHNALFFTLYDNSYSPVLYVQNIENLRTDVKLICTYFFEKQWYFNYMKKTLEVPISFGETWFGLMTDITWATQQVVVEDANSGQSISWWLYGSASGKMSKGNQIMLDIIKTNRFINPVHYSIIFNFEEGILNLGGFFIPEGLVYKLKTKMPADPMKLQQMKLQDLSFDVVKNSKIPSIDLRFVLDYVRYQYLMLIDAFLDQGDHVNAGIIKTSMENNLPFDNYPFFIESIENNYKSIVNKLDYTDDQRKQKEKSEIREYLQKNNLAGTSTASGLYYIETKAGTGPEAMPGNTVKVHYTGTLLDGTKFDSSYDRSEPFEFELGAGQVIKGWDEGIAMMKLGSKGILIIPYDLGYGEKDRGSNLPGYSTLVFEVELVEIN